MKTAKLTEDEKWDENPARNSYETDGQLWTELMAGWPYDDYKWLPKATTKWQSTIGVPEEFYHRSKVAKTRCLLPLPNLHQQKRIRREIEAKKGKEQFGHDQIQKVWGSDSRKSTGESDSRKKTKRESVFIFFSESFLSSDSKVNVCDQFCQTWTVQHRLIRNKTLLDHSENGFNFRARED